MKRALAARVGVVVGVVGCGAGETSTPHVPEAARREPPPTIGFAVPRPGRPWPADVPPCEVKGVGLGRADSSAMPDRLGLYASPTAAEPMGSVKVPGKPQSP